MVRKSLVKKIKEKIKISKNSQKMDTLEKKLFSTRKK